jgi:type II secretory pathway component GspD/PulD (secretin)
MQFTYLDDTEVEAIIRAVRKSERVNRINAPNLLISNNGRASMSVINQVSYIKDFDVEIAQASAIADPIVDVISDGVILDVRPVVSADRRYITLELRPTVSQLERPIQFRDVSFAFGNSGRLQLPKVEVQRVRTTVTVPDGGTLLLGGLKVAEERDAQSGVPILSDLPILSFFFSRKGQFKRYKHLMILLKANVVIMNELEPGLGVRK